MIGFDPKHDLGFFASLRRNHFPPFYHISALHNSLQTENAPSATKEILVRKVLRALQDVSDAQHINVMHASAMQHTVLQSDIAVEGSTNEMVGKGLEVDGCDNIDQQTHVEEDTEHGSQRGSSVLTESEDTNNEHQVIRFILFILFI